MKRFTTLSTLVGVLLVTVAISAQGRGGGGPQVPTPKNLQFFPKDFTGQQILPIMQNFNAALGVNCTVLPQCSTAARRQPEERLRLR